MEKSKSKNKAIFFDDFKVDRMQKLTAQANILYGYVSKIKHRVVCKQYSVLDFKTMIKEIRIFDCLERQRTQKSSDPIEEFNKAFHEADGLPKLLGYSLSIKGGEILMIYAGKSLEKWYRQDFSRLQ